MSVLFVELTVRAYGENSGLAGEFIPSGILSNFYLNTFVTGSDSRNAIQCAGHYKECSFTYSGDKSAYRAVSFLIIGIL